MQKRSRFSRAWNKKPQIMQLRDFTHIFGHKSNQSAKFNLSIIKIIKKFCFVDTYIETKLLLYNRVS